MTPPEDRPTASPGSSASDDLAVKNLDLVGRVISRMPISLPPSLDRDDLISVGTLGLLQAARTYQPLRGAAFRTYAWLAIRAAVLDELRRHDSLPRGVRSRLKSLAALESEYRSREGRLPLPTEIAAGLSISDDESEQLLAWAAEADLLRTAQGAGDDEIPEPADERAPEPITEAERREQLECVERAIRELVPRERQVFVLYHSEGLYLKEIGELLGVTESRVSQILACAQRKVRSRLEQSNHAAASRRSPE